MCGLPMAASATGLTATRPPRGLNSSEKLPWEGVHPSPRTTNSTHSSELPRSLWSTPGVSPNSRVHIPVTSGPPPGPVIDPCGGVGKRVNFTQTGVGLARSPQPPDARRAALHWPRVPGGQTNSGALTAAPPLVVETANRAGLSDVHPPQGPARGLMRSPQPPDARRAAFNWPRVPGGTN